jgi:hypothetical protein
VSTSEQPSLSIQASAESIPAVPPWFGEVVLTSDHMRRQGVLSVIKERVRFARRLIETLLRHRFCGCAHWLCNQWRTHPRSIL